MICKACHDEAGDGLLCRACGAVLPPRRVDLFAALGVPRTYALATADLEARYRELSRKLHPDRFATAAAEGRIASVQATTTLNEAYRTLRHPVRRAEALLELHGLPITDEDRVAPAFLQEILELREALEEAKGSGDQAAIDRMADDVGARRRAALDAIARRFAEHERTGDRAALEAVKAELIALRYFDRFLEAREGLEED